MEDFFNELPVTLFIIAVDDCRIFIRELKAKYRFFFASLVKDKRIVVTQAFVFLYGCLQRPPIVNPWIINFKIQIIIIFIFRAVPKAV